MFGFITIIAFVIAWNTGGWWWLLAIFIGLAWIGSKGEKEAKKQEKSTAPLDSNALTPKSGDAQKQTEILDGVYDRIAMLTEICARFSGSDFYVAELIPRNKLLNATKSYPAPSDGKIIALIDATVMGSAENGMAISEHGISWHNDWTTDSKITTMQWRNLADKAIETSGPFDVQIGDGNKFNTSGCGFERHSIINLLRELQGATSHLNPAIQRPAETKSSPSAFDLVDINTADSDHLISLPGLNAAEAMMILERRASGGHFYSLDEFSDFLSLKPHKVEQLRNRVVFWTPDVSLATNANSPRMEPTLVSSPSSKASSRSSGRVID